MPKILVIFEWASVFPTQNLFINAYFIFSLAEKKFLFSRDHDLEL